MGRIRTKQVKNLSKDLVESHPDKFSTDFEENKKFLDELGLENKFLRNKLAGYIVILKKEEKT